MKPSAGQRAAAVGVRYATPEDGTINYNDPARTDVEVDKLYGNTGAISGAIANGVAGHGFRLSGLSPAVPGTEWTLSVSAGDRSWAANAARVNFYSAKPASLATFVASVTALVTLSADGQTVRVAGASVPAGANFGATNLKYLVDGVYTNTNDVPAGASEALEPYVMVNHGPAACLTAPGEGVFDVDPTAPDLSDGRVFHAHHGQKRFLRSDWFDPTKHFTERFSLELGTATQNAGLKLGPHVLIPVATSGSETPGAFTANYTVTPTSQNTLAIINDNSPARRVNQGYRGGEHGPIGWRYAVTHGKAKVDLGSVYAMGGKEYPVAAIRGSGLITFAAALTGGYEDWLQDATNPGTGTFTHVRGGTNTADIVVGSIATQVQLYPALQDVVWTVLDEGARFVEDYGVYDAGITRIHQRYRNPNTKRLYEWIETQAGTDADLVFNHPDVGSDFICRLEYLKGARGKTSGRYEIEAVEGHTVSMEWPSQHQALAAVLSLGEKFWLLVPNTVPFQSGISQSGGNLRDLAAWSDMTGNAVEYYSVASTWEPGAYWADGQQRPTRVFAEDIRSSAGVPRVRKVIANSALQGRTFETDYSTTSMFWSAQNKLYPATKTNVFVSAGLKEVTFAYEGYMDLDLDPEAEINTAFPMFGGGYEWIWYSRNGALADYPIPLPPEVVGRAIEIGADSGGEVRSASATVAFVDGEPRVTTTGPAFVTFRAR